MDVEIVIAALPEGPLRSPGGCGNLERLDRGCHGSMAGFVDEQMHMLGHDYITENRPLVAIADKLEGVLECLRRLNRVQVRQAVIATERDEVQRAAMLVSSQAARHGWDIRARC